MNRSSRRRNAARISLRIFVVLLSLHGLLCCLHQVNASIVTSETTPRSPSASAAAAATGEEGGGIDPSSTSWSTALLDQTSKNQDPYVNASPLNVAAVCRDGIALVSLHYVGFEEARPDDASSYSNASSSCEAPCSSSNGNETPDKVSRTGDGLPDEPNDYQSNKHQLSFSRKFCDLPMSSRGPLRIEPIYETANVHRSPPPMSLLTAGWRTDGMVLADAARELVGEEVRLYCLPSLALRDSAGIDSAESVVDGYRDREEKTPNGRLEGKRQQKIQYNTNNAVVKRDSVPDKTMGRQSHYGRRIAKGLSYYLAKCVFSEGVRSLSCIGLLACGSDCKGKGSLYLVDATGTHRVRAHAIGDGSSALHKRLVCVDFEKMDCHEGLKVLLYLVAQEGGLVPVDSNADAPLDVGGKTAKSLQGGESGSSSVMEKPSFVSKGRSQQLNEGKQSAPFQHGRQWNLPSNVGAELAVLKSGEGRMRRVRLSTLFPTIHTAEGIRPRQR